MKFTSEEMLRTGGISGIEVSQPDDLLIVSASFEARTMFIAENLAKSYRATRAIVYVNREFVDGNAGRVTRPNLYRLIDQVGRHSDSVKVVEGSWLSPGDQLNQLRAAIQSDTDGEAILRVTIDCTTFNRESLLTTVLLVRSMYGSALVRVLYSAPKAHGEWLSRGYRCLRNVIGLSGVHYSRLPTVVAVLSGFEPHRTLAVIEEHEPALVLLGVGDPPTASEFLERNLESQKLVLSRQDVKEFRFAVSDIGKCVESLDEVLTEHIGKSNIVLAPMSTKFSTLAGLLFAEKAPETQITYCLPGEYNISQYSDGVRAVYSETLPRRIPETSQK